MLKDNLVWLIPLVVIIGFLVFKTLAQVPKPEAVALLKQGALLLDVRGIDEYAADAVGNAVNVPIDSLESRMADRFPDKSRPILVHCLSGTRSAFAVRTLRRIGYTNVQDLGSIQRARAVAAEAGLEK